VEIRRVIPRDAIPSVDDPEFADRYDGDPDDEVIVVDAERARAYPVRYLHYHEIVNDRVADPAGTDSPGDGGVPIAVTWCPLCASAVVYDRRVGGERLTFGVSGKLADDDLVMYDRETDSEWKQSSGACIAGTYGGERLRVLPAAMTSYERFRESHPDGVVLAPPGGESEASGPGDEPEPIDYDDAPYRRYFETEGFGLDAHRGEGSREWDREDIDPKGVVLGIESDEEALGVPMALLEEAGGVVRVSVGETDAVVFATDEGIHAFADPGIEFERDGSGFRGDGTVWDGATGEAADGRRLDRLPARRLFAFAWQDDHGPGAFLTDAPDDGR